jgi:hypothetical protein
MSIKPAEAAKLAELRSLHINTERDRELARHLGRLLKLDEAGNQVAAPVHFNDTLETRGIMFIEPAGGGKTTAINRFLSHCDALNPHDGLRRYLRVEVPKPASLKSLGIQILASCEFPTVSARATAPQIWTALRHQLQQLGIVVLWIDEAHDLFRAQHEINDMLSMLKSLMQDPPAVILILSGTRRLSKITSYDPQVSRRLTKMSGVSTHGTDRGD